MNTETIYPSLFLAEKQWQETCKLVKDLNYLASDLILDNKNADQVIKMLFEAEDLRGIYAKIYLDTLYKSNEKHN